MGRRLMAWLPVQISGDTLLRVVRRTIKSPGNTCRVVGVDDWALKKGKRYGTILVDLEQHQVIDLLPDREAGTLATWLQQHPNIQILTRDRSTEYKLGMTEGASQARQVADRWHLLLNLRQMVERAIQSIYADLQRLPVAPEHLASLQALRPRLQRSVTAVAITQNDRRSRLEKYEWVQVLRDEGFNMSQIVQKTGFARSTVRKYYHAAHFPERKKAPLRPSRLDPYLPYLEQQIQAGADNASQLFRDIQKMGYPGGSNLVHRWVNSQRSEVSPSTRLNYRDTALKPPRADYELPSAGQLAWLVVRDPEQLEQDEQHRLKHILQHASLKQLYAFAQQFRTIVKNGLSDELDAWIHTGRSSDFATVTTFVQGIQQDYEAVIAALHLPWSNGQTEGQVNRLKFIKRQM